MPELGNRKKGTACNPQKGNKTKSELQHVTNHNKIFQKR